MDMMNTRSCRFSGSFFPGEAGALKDAVSGFLTAAHQAGANGPGGPRAVIAPHAGYRYSGRFAGLSYAGVGWRPDRVVILSPSHRHAFRGIAFPGQAAFATPLGPVPIDRTACDRLAGQGLAHLEDPAHDNEHGIETQLPFIRVLWPGVAVVPLVIGAAEADQVAAAVDALDGPGTLVVISSDLSHFLDQPAAQAQDSETARLIETGDWRKLTPAHACGMRGLQGWMASRAGQGTKPLRLGMGDSAEVSGDRSRVVGYGAWGFYPIGAAMLAERWRGKLLRAARRALASRLDKGHAPQVAAESFPAPLQTHAASFVTLTRAGRLRGCIGSLVAQRPLVADALENTQKAALNDPRFAPVDAALLPELKLKIAVLSRPGKMDFSTESEALARIVPGQDGLILSAMGRRGTFLPMVWDSLPEPRDFLRQLKRKAGLAEDHWSADLTLHRFRAENFSEPD